jgi:outer membrane protein assembly factor BamD (BamD/ComL family)
MEPIAIQASKGEAGVQIESFDAEELFEQAGAALSQKRFDDAVRLYDKLLGSFTESPYVRPAMYNRAWPWSGRRTGTGRSRPSRR